MAISRHAQERLTVRAKLHGATTYDEALGKIKGHHNDHSGLVVIHLAQATVVGRTFHFVAVCKNGVCVTVEWTDTLSKIH